MDVRAETEFEPTRSQRHPTNLRRTVPQRSRPRASVVSRPSAVSLRAVLCWLLLAGALPLVFVAGYGARPSAAAQPADDSAKPDKQPPAPAAVPLAQIPAEGEAAAALLRKLVADDEARPVIAAIDADLPALGRDIHALARENKGILAQRPALDLLRAMDSRWHSLRGRLAASSERLQRLVASHDQTLARIDRLQASWSATLAAAREEKAPPELIRRTEALLAEIASARRTVEARRADALKLQTRIADLDARVDEALQANRTAREATVGRMLTRDSAPLWDRVWDADAVQRIWAGAGAALESQSFIVSSYLRDHASRLALHATLLIALTALFHWVRKRLRSLIAQEPALERPATVVEHPLASALVLALMLTHWIYPQPPRLILALTGIALFVPTIIVLRRLVSRVLLAPLYAVLVFYFVDQARAVTASIEIVPRVLFVIEMLAAAAFLGWFRARGCTVTDGTAQPRHLPLLRLGAAIAVVLCLASAAANTAGFVTLAKLVGDAVLESLYAGLVLYTVVQILDALIEIALRVQPLAALRMVRAHRELLQSRLRRAMQWAAAAIWALHTLALLAVRAPVLDALRAALGASLTVGSIDISLADVLAFVAAVWAAFLFSRLVRFVLAEEVFPHAPLKRGIPYAISRTLHFAIIALGFVVAMGVIGMEMTQLTILASAFTIGIGFGLQNIFNNFVSGLIVLFERPVQVGDMIQIDDAVGVVHQIGIRASVIRTASGSEVIVPNGKLISDRVINWTLTARQRVIEVPISVVLQSDPRQVIEILEEVAKQHRDVLQDPPPQAIVTRLGPDWMGLELRASISDVERWMILRSELTVAAAAAMRAAGVTLR